MPDLYLIIIVLLFALAITDLIVGVSNDAVNFLNSAIGSQVASRKVIMIIASLGILMGATFSSGMMEIARKGIFNPEHFFFAEIMIIFIAVMITDILLLDLFNTFGMPTSTTVSIVFELLGAAVAISILKINAAGDSLSTLGEYINSSSAILIISGIFISILIAFVIGSILQFISRLLFTFHIEKKMAIVGVLWSGLALAALTYFLLIKGIKGASFVSPNFVSWIQNNTLWLLLISFGLWSLLMQILYRYFKINVLRIVVLFGTFALAMAFAGNDLVNFIGVPVAGLVSYTAWSSSGVSAELYSMEILTGPVRTQTYLLALAGVIMIVTLWFSKKARSVTETEVNLGRQDEGAERFTPNRLSQIIVRNSLLVGEGISKVLPASWLEKAKKNLVQPRESLKKPVGNTPAFDLLRASVNLSVASILIAFATSLKLPLSTTYVSFMVAMGTSLADKAWGRSSAVYRISGVISVVGGWFFTAIMAFTVAATFAVLIYWGGAWAIAALVALAAFLISRTFLLHKKKEKSKEEEQQFEQESGAIPAAAVVNDTAEKVELSLQIIRRAYQEAIAGLLGEDRATLKKAKKSIAQLKEKNLKLKKKLYKLIKRIEKDHLEASQLYLLVYDMNQDIVQSASLIVKSCQNYVENSLEPLPGEQAIHMRKIAQLIDEYLEQVINIVHKPQKDKTSDILDRKENAFAQIDDFLAYQFEGIKEESLGMRNSLLIFNVILETKDLLEIAERYAQMYYRVKTANGEGHKAFQFRDLV